MYEIQGSWRDIYYYTWKAINENNNISFQKFYNDPNTQRRLQEQFHNLGPDLTKSRFKEMFAEIKYNHYGIEDDCEEEKVVNESLRTSIKKQAKNEKNFEKLVENIVNRLNK